MLRSHSQQALDKFKNLLLRSRAALFLKGVLCVFGPAAWKITPVIRVASTRHAQLVAVINLGNAAHGENQTEGELQAGGCSLGYTGKARGVMIREKRNQELRMGIKRILTQNVRQLSNRRSFQQNVTHGEIKRNIKRGGELRVHAIPDRSPALEERSHRGIGMEHFTDGREPWIDFAQFRVPLVPKLPRNVRESINAIA